MSDSRRFLTAEQRHSLLKSLVCAQMLDEWALLDEPDGLKQYGPPFINNGTPAPESTGTQAEQYPEHTEKPIILIHLFHVHLRRFPGLKTAKVDYWRKRIVPFFEKVSQAVFSNSQERSELTGRKLLAFVATRYIATFWTRGIGIRGQGELRGAGKGEVGSEKWGVGKKWGKGTVKRGLERPVRPTKKDMDQIEQLFQDDKEDDIIWNTAGKNVKRLKRDWSAWKESIIESEEGLKQTLQLLETKSLNNLPSEYRNATEWVRRHVAFVLWTIFVQYPGGDEIMSIIKTIHTLFPYWGAKQLLKIANAQKMIKAIIDLILARPVGMVDSLGQRIFFAIMNNEIGYINKNFLGPLRKAIKDDKLCTILDTYVKTRTNQQRADILLDARNRNQDTLVSILDDGQFHDMDMILDWQQEFVASPYRSHLDWAYPAASLEAKKMTNRPPSNLSESKSSSGAVKFAQLKLYLRERLRRRDREKVLEIGTGPLVPDIIKESLEIVFYSIIYEIALASDLSSRLGDLQRFVDDMIRVKSKKMDTLEDWIALCARHENSLYIFVHEIRDAVKPVFDWCQEALDFMALSTTDPSNPSNRKAINVEINLDDLLLEAKQGGIINVDAVFQELRALERYSKWYKIDQEVQMRKEYTLIKEDSVSNVTILPKGQSSTLTPSASMKKNLDNVHTINLVKKLMKLQKVTWDDGIVRTDSRGTEAGELPWGYFGPDDILHQHYLHPDEVDQVEPLQYSVDQRVTPIPPTMSHIRSLLPLFRQNLQRKLPNWVKKAQC